MRVLLIAPPGGGKGTQATRIADRYGITHISSGELFRRHVAERTPEGEAISRYVARGDLVPDDLALQLLRAPIVAANRAGGFVLDQRDRGLARGIEALGYGVIVCDTVMRDGGRTLARAVLGDV